MDCFKPSTKLSCFISLLTFSLKPSISLFTKLIFVSTSPAILSKSLFNDLISLLTAVVDLISVYKLYKFLSIFKIVSTWGADFKTYAVSLTAYIYAESDLAFSYKLSKLSLN